MTYISSKRREQHEALRRLAIVTVGCVLILLLLIYAGA